MVNYKAIADEVELKGYADYETAFAAMSIETEDKWTELSSNNLREWAVLNEPDYIIIKTNGDVLTEMAMKQLEIDSSPLDVRKASIRALIDGLGISATGKANLYSAATMKVKVWQGLKPGHIQNALQKRAEGKV